MIKFGWIVSYIYSLDRWSKTIHSHPKKHKINISTRLFPQMFPQEGLAPGDPLALGDLVVVTEAGQSPRNGCVEELNSETALIRFWKEGDSRFFKYSGEAKRFNLEDRENIELERDHLVKSDNYKSFWGPHDVTFQGQSFGTRVLKRRIKIAVEAGMRLRPSPCSKDCLVVLGLLLSVRSRKTSIAILLFDPKSNLLSSLDMSLLEKVWDDKSRLQDATVETMKSVVVGRALMTKASNFDSSVEITPHNFLGSDTQPKTDLKRRRVGVYPATAGIIRLSFYLLLSQFLIIDPAIRKPPSRSRRRAPLTPIPCKKTCL